MDELVVNEEEQMAMYWHLEVAQCNRHVKLARCQHLSLITMMHHDDDKMHHPKLNMKHLGNNIIH